MSRDLLVVWRRPGDVLLVLAFFLLAASLFPLGVGPEPQVLQRIGPGVLWVAALFAHAVARPAVREDLADGSLEHLALAPLPLELTALAKCLAHWVTGGLPLTLMSPALGLLFGLDAAQIGVLMISLLLGTPSLSLLGGLGAALTLGARRGGALMALLVLPLAVPVLIFGVASVESLAAGEGSRNALVLLAAFFLVALASTPGRWRRRCGGGRIDRTE